MLSSLLKVNVWSNQKAQCAILICCEKISKKMTDTKKNLSHKMSISTTEKLNSYRFNGLLLKKKNLSLYLFTSPKSYVHRIETMNLWWSFINNIFLDLLNVISFSIYFPNSIFPFSNFPLFYWTQRSFLMKITKSKLTWKRKCKFWESILQMDERAIRLKCRKSVFKRKR